MLAMLSPILFGSPSIDWSFRFAFADAFDANGKKNEEKNEVDDAAGVDDAVDSLEEEEVTVEEEEEEEEEEIASLERRSLLSRMILLGAHDSKHNNEDGEPEREREEEERENGEGEEEEGGEGGVSRSRMGYELTRKDIQSVHLDLVFSLPPSMKSLTSSTVTPSIANSAFSEVIAEWIFKRKKMIRNHGKN
jgi:hypothetical protein